ncbi:MAG TPA: serine esterase [Verrucomicrobiae bacterium]|nr:serine esterase [Verrucomicrobiae bacterium]
MLSSKLIPAREKSSRSLLVALHGLGDSAAGYESLPVVLGLPWLNCLLVNAPDPYYGGLAWYDLTGDSRPGIERSRRLLFGLLDAQRAAGFPSEQTTLFGFSQGCVITIDVGFRYPHLLAGLIGISGYVHEPEELLRELSPVARKQRMLFTHGTQDPLIPCATVRGQVERLKSAGLDITWREFAKTHTIAGEEEIALVRDFLRTCYGRGDSSR